MSAEREARMSGVDSGWWLMSLAAYRKGMGAESIAYFNRDGGTLLIRATRKVAPKGDVRGCNVVLGPTTAFYLAPFSLPSIIVVTVRDAHIHNIPTGTAANRSLPSSGEEPLK